MAAPIVSRERWAGACNLKLAAGQGGAAIPDAGVQGNVGGPPARAANSLSYDSSLGNTHATSPDWKGCPATKGVCGKLIGALTGSRCEVAGQPVFLGPNP